MQVIVRKTRRLVKLAGEPAPSKPATAQPAGKGRQPDRSKPAAAPPRKQARPDQNLFVGMSAEKGGKSARPQKAGSAADAPAGSPADESAAAAKHSSPGSKASAAMAATSSKAGSKAKHASATAADATAKASAAAAVAPDSAAAGKPTPKLVAVSFWGRHNSVTTHALEMVSRIWAYKGALALLDQWLCSQAGALAVLGDALLLACRLVHQHAHV